MIIDPRINRRAFLAGSLAGAGALAAAGPLWAKSLGKKPFQGPNAIIIRFGGGVRRRETIDPDHTYSPYMAHELVPRGVLFKDLTMRPKSEGGSEANHGQGTLNILTGHYDEYKDVDGKFFGERFEAKVPTLFEYLRKEYEVPEDQTLIVNTEDRTDEEFYSFSNHHLYGANYRSNTLSLYRYKVFLLRRQIEDWTGTDNELRNKQKKLEKLLTLDYRVTSSKQFQSHKIEAFWEKWRAFYRDSGFVNPRGDRLLTELSLWALKELRPRLMMINYTDPDYVHWGNPSHYTRGISVIDQGLRRLVEAVATNNEYRDRTLFVIVPDCGRDNNRSMAVPFQHHSESKSAREIFALFFGPGIPKGDIVDKPADQTDIAPTLARLMGFKARFSEGRVLEEAFA